MEKTGNELKFHQLMIVQYWSYLIILLCQLVLSGGCLIDMRKLSFQAI